MNARLLTRAVKPMVCGILCMPHEITRNLESFDATFNALGILHRTWIPLPSSCLCSDDPISWNSQSWHSLLYFMLHFSEVTLQTKTSIPSVWVCTTAQPLKMLQGRHIPSIQQALLISHTKVGGYIRQR